MIAVVSVLYYLYDKNIKIVYTIIQNGRNRYCKKGK